MIKFGFAKSFERSIKGLHNAQKVEIQRQVDSFMLAMDVGRIPGGFGVKKLERNLWEFRTDIAIRILFDWKKSSIIFLFVGNHNEVQQFLRYYR